MNERLRLQIDQYLNPNDNLHDHPLLKHISETYDAYELQLAERWNDITTAKQKTDELHHKLQHESNELKEVSNELDKITGRIGEILFSVDMIGYRLSKISAACEKIYGYTPEEFYTNHELWNQVIHPEDVHISHAQVATLQQGQEVHNQYRVIHKNGTIRWVENSVFPTLDNTGRLVRLDGVTSDITARKAIEDKIKASEERYRIVAENPILGIAWGTAGGQVLEVNDAFSSLLGYSKEELLSMHFTSFTHPDDYGTEFLLIHQMMNGEIDNYKIEKRFLTKNSEVLWVELNASGLRNAAGNIQFVIAVVQNINQRKAMEESLQKSEQNLRNILENTDTAYVLIDKNATILSYNHLAVELMQELMDDKLEAGKNYVEAMHSDRRENVRRSIEYVLKNRKQLGYEVRYTTVNQVDKWLQVNMHPIINSLKELIGLSISATNITARRNIEQEIKQVNERYELVLKATNDVIWDWDIENDRISRSGNYKNIYGYTVFGGAESLKSWTTHVHPDDRERVMQSIMEATQNPEARLWKDEYRFFRHNGEIAYVQDRGYIIQDEEGKAIRMVGATWDVTPEKIHEIEREQISSDLIQRNQDLEQFTYIVSHNLRSPVANIIGLSNMLNDPEFELDAPTQKNFISGLSLSALRLDEVIRDLNNILQVKLYTSQSREPLSFSDIMDSVKLHLQDVIEKQQVEIRTDFSAVNEMTTLKSYMHSIFHNMVLNSIKYKQPDVPAIIEITSALNNNGMVELRFKDNGMGIDMEKHGNSLFGLYKRFHLGIEGKGMGLYMVKTHAERMGGTISVESEVNKGTTFRMVFGRE
jgi:PAS domain S-box-containing protein